jgi:hypothetical protein
MRIVECYAYVRDSQRFAAEGYTLSAYQVTDPIDEPPPDKNGAQRFTFLGWEREPTILFNQPDPAAAGYPGGAHNRGLLMSGMEPLLIAGAVGGTAISAYGHHKAGEEAARSAEFEKQQLEIQSQVAKTNADQAETSRRNELTSNLETIMAIRAGRGVGSGSPTGEAMYTSAIDSHERDIATERANYLTKADLSRRGADMAERKAKYSLLAGDLQAAGDVFSGVSKVGSIYGYGKTKAG